MNPRPTAILTESQVVEILQRLDRGEYQHLIARCYGVSTKTISRIKNGETWSNITQRYRTKDCLLPVIKITPIPIETIDLLDEIIAIKNHFGFSFEHPMHWGWFDAWDGLHSVVSDGIIMWESADLVSYARKLSTCNINKHPVWASYAEELPTFDLEDVMTLPVGDKLRPDTEANGAVKLVCETTAIFLHSKFVNIAHKMKLDIRLAGQSDEFVYLTKLKPKSPVDPTHVVMACVAAMST